MRIILTKEFTKKLKKFDLKYHKKVKSRLELFKENINDRILNNHKLKGKLKGKSSINVTADIRAIYKQEGDKMIFIFLDLGTHSDLYK